MTALGPRSEAVRRLRRLVSRRAARWEERAFVVEGAKLLGEALDAGASIDSVYLDRRDATDGHRALAARAEAAGARVADLEPGVLARVCDAVAPPPLAAVVAMVDVPVPPIGDFDAGLALLGVEIQDPGNAGAVLRSAAASGCAAVMFSEGSVDVYNPKAVRSTAGALFHVPVVVGFQAARLLGELAAHGVRRMGTVATGGRDYTEVDLTGPTALVLGNEAHGLPSWLDAHLDERLTIPMAGPAESLNVAMAASVLCFEAARQRRMRGER